MTYPHKTHKLNSHRTPLKKMPKLRWSKTRWSSDKGLRPSSRSTSGPWYPAWDLNFTFYLLINMQISLTFLILILSSLEMAIGDWLIWFQILSLKDFEWRSNTWLLQNHIELRFFYLRFSSSPSRLGINFNFRNYFRVKSGSTKGHFGRTDSHCGHLIRTF